MIDFSHFNRKMNSSVAFISEYSNKQKIQSRVAKFNKGLVRFLLVTERAHFFQVYAFLFLDLFISL